MTLRGRAKTAPAAHGPAQSRPQPGSPAPIRSPRFRPSPRLCDSRRELPAAAGPHPPSRSFAPGGTRPMRTSTDPPAALPRAICPRAPTGQHSPAVLDVPITARGDPLRPVTDTANAVLRTMPTHRETRPSRAASACRHASHLAFQGENGLVKFGEGITSATARLPERAECQHGDRYDHDRKTCPGDPLEGASTDPEAR
jgi:hypothetical protein